MKVNKLLCTIGGCALVLGVIVAVIRINALFLPKAAEVFGAVFPALILIMLGVGVITLSIVLPKRRAKQKSQVAARDAESCAVPAYSYESAYEALRTRQVAWESTTWSDENRRKEAVKALKVLAQSVQDIGKMSTWFTASLDDLLHAQALEAVRRIDTAKLKFLSGFISYCASATEYELLGAYFKEACDKACEEVTETLELYASMRTKLSSFSGNDEDLEKLRNEIKQITSMFN